MTSPQQIERFKKEFTKYQTLLNLQDYKIEFRFGGLEDEAWAMINADVEHRIAIVWISHMFPETFDVEKTAKHEAIHLFLAPMRNMVKLSDQSSKSDFQLNSIEEGMVHILVNILP